MLDSPRGERVGGRQDLASVWGLAVKMAVCEHCDWLYLAPADSELPKCPHCWREALTSLNDPSGHLPHLRPPELLLPFSVSSERVADGIRDFAGGIPFAPADLRPQHLRDRLQCLYLPQWLVDVDVEATWEAEAGFDYEVVSHQDRFEHGRWVEQAVTETRVRWEPRVGRLTRRYENVPAAALEDEAELRRRLGGYDGGASQPYAPEAVVDALVRLPDREPADAWSDAVPPVRATASEECRQAAGADHVRQFAWTPEYHNLNWTQLLRPAYATYYLDDDAVPQPVLVHGQSGRVSGTRRASMKRARRASLVMVLVAAIIAIVGGVTAVAPFVPPTIAPLGNAGLIVALLVAALAIVPIAVVRHFNRRAEKQPE